MKKINEEKGSITLYVLVAMMLILSVTLLIYIQISQRNNAQLKELEKIQEEYQISTKDLDDSYSQIIDKNNMEIYIVLTTPDGKKYDINQWTKEDLSLKIYYPNDVPDNEKYYYRDGEKIKYTGNEIIDDNCTIRVEYGDETKEIHITKIDKVLPTVTLEPDGGDKTISVGDTTANISVKVEATDNESGIKKVEYQISTSGTTPSEDDSNWKEIENGGTINENKEGGKYYIYTKVTDNAGNVSIEKSQLYNLTYEVRYDANGGSGAPSVQAKENGTTLVLSSTKPTRTGYTFLGWSTSKTATNATYEAGASYTVDSAVTLYAVWKVNSYNVRFDNNYMTSNLMPSTYTASTYVGWRVSTTNSVVTDSSAVNGQAVKIVFPGYEGRSGVQKTLASDLTVGKTYTFSVYLKASRSHSGVVIGPQQGGTTTVNVTTSWQKFTYTFVAKSNQYTTFVIYSNANESVTTDRWNNGDILYVSGLELMEGTYSNYTQSSKTYNTALGTLPAPTRSLYTLDGWYTAPVGGTKISTSTTVPANDVTYYAHWKGNPTLSITKQPSALTVVAGNKGSFSVTVSGNGTIKYQWYYNTSGGNSSGTAVSGATGNTYSFTSSSGMNNRYYYCTITCTVGGVTKTVKSNAVKLTVQAANYSTLKSGTTTYYNTLNSAINGATSGGGDSGGGTITVLNSLTDNSSASTNKTIAINTNGKTVTRNASIITTGGTLTIKGNGSIYCNSSSVATVQCNGGNLSTAGKVLLKGYTGVITNTANRKS